MFFQNIGNRLPIDVALHPTNRNSQSHLVKNFNDLTTKFYIGVLLHGIW